MEEKQKLQEGEIKLTVDSQSTFDETGLAGNGVAALSSGVLSNGQIFAGQYEILEKLGEGGMSVVYKARHLTVDRIVAVKVLLPGRELDETSMQRFQQEARAAARLDHPGIVRVFDFGLDEELNCPFLVMEYVQGQTLGEVLEERGALPEAQAKDIVLQVAEAIEHAHQRFVVHRDIKPSNIILQQVAGDRLRAQVLDFGIAKVIDKEAGQLTITRTGEIFGSPDYMSPEQCLGKALDNRADIYSLGCVLYECVMGRAPFHCDSPVETMMLQLSQKAVDFHTNVLSRPLQNAILKALEKDPASRFQSMEAFCQALGGGRAVQASLDTRLAFYLRQLRRNPKYALPSVVAFVLIFYAVFYIIEDNRDPTIGVDSQNNPLSWYALSEKFEKKGKKDKQIDALKHAIALRPDYYEAHYDLGKTLAYGKRDYVNGLAALERAEALSKGNVYVNQMIAMCLTRIAPEQIRAGKLLDAAANYERLSKLEPKNPEHLAALGEIALRTGDTPKAAEYFKRALALDPEFSTMWWHLNGLRKAGMDSEADRIKAFYKGRQILDSADHG